jgi:hypothetical protein
MIRRRLETTDPDASGAQSAALAVFFIGLVAGAACMGLAGCYGRSDGGAERFLRGCAEACGAELECIGGICTRSCENVSDCSDLELRAQCLDASELATSGTCDVACVDDSGCQGLGASFMCRDGACRQTVRNPIPRVGEPCVPSDEAEASFAGFSVGEINIEAGGSCGASNVCLVNHFQGRVTCPAGDDAETGSQCSTSTGQALKVPVPPQLARRTPEQAVVCSCRCDGPDPTADYCACPDGMRCEELIPSTGFLNGAADYLGSYCVY